MSSVSGERTCPRGGHRKNDLPSDSSTTSPNGWTDGTGEHCEEVDEAVESREELRRGGRGAGQGCRGLALLSLLGTVGKCEVELLACRSALNPNG